MNHLYKMEDDVYILADISFLPYVDKNGIFYLSSYF